VRDITKISLRSLNPRSAAQHAVDVHEDHTSGLQASKRMNEGRKEGKKLADPDAAGVVARVSKLWWNLSNNELSNERHTAQQCSKPSQKPASQGRAEARSWTRLCHTNGA